MKLVMLGTGGFLPCREAETACYYLPEHGIFLDGGTGLYRMADYMQTREVDVYLSHTHGDHTLGLHWFFAGYFKKMMSETSEPVDTALVARLSRRANELLGRVRIHVTEEMLPLMKPQFHYELDWRILDGLEPLPGGGTLTQFRLKAEREEIGFRLDWPGHSLAYITDTTASLDADYIEKIAGVDLLLHDCNLPDDKAEIAGMISHSSTSAVAQVAAMAGVKRLILIHKNPLGWPLEPDLPAARQIFANTEIGHDGMEVEF